MAQPVVQDSLNASYLERLLPRRPLLADLPLTSKTTRRDVTALWGPGSFGMSSFVYYTLNTGEEIELLFSPIPPYGLVSVRLVDAAAPRSVPPQGRVLFHDNPRAQLRRREQVAQCESSARYVRKIWGPPDYEMGSGMPYGFYELADGSTVTVRDIPQPCDRGRSR